MKPILSVPMKLKSRALLSMRTVFMSMSLSLAVRLYFMNWCACELCCCYFSSLVYLTHVTVLSIDVCVFVYVQFFQFYIPNTVLPCVLHIHYANYCTITFTLQALFINRALVHQSPACCAPQLHIILFSFYSFQKALLIRRNTELIILYTTILLGKRQCVNALQ